MLDVRKKNFYPKGRNADDSDISEIKNLIGDLPLKRDMLIEYLHLIQDKFGEIRKTFSCRFIRNFKNTNGRSF